MLTDSPIMAFVATQRPDEARAFYEGVLGLTLVEDTPFAIVFDCGGTSLRVQKAQAVTPAPYTALGWHVADIEATVDGLVEKGVTFTRYGFLEQDDRGVWTTPDGSARVAWFTDPDGNTLSLTES